MVGDEHLGSFHGFRFVAKGDPACYGETFVYGGGRRFFFWFGRGSVFTQAGDCRFGHLGG